MECINSLFSSHQFNLKKIIPDHLINKLGDDCIRFRVYDPITTLYCFLHQSLNNASCKSAVSNLNIQRIKLGMKIISMNTAALTKAKKRLNETTLSNIAKTIGLANDKVGNWKWQKKDVYLIDGTVLNLEDTERNKSEYPLNFTQSRSIGMPKLRMLGVFSLGSGSLIDAEIGGYIGKGQGETTLLRSLLPRLRQRSVLVLDRLFTSFALQDYLIRNKFDYVIRARDKAAKKLLGRKSDVVVTLERGRLETYAPELRENLSESINVRMIKSSIKRNGFRVATIYIMTSFTDKKLYKKDELEEIYLKRWGIELDIRHLKVTLDASLLRSKSPDTARKELWVHLIGFNIVRKIIGMTSVKFNKAMPRSISFKTTLNVFLQSISTLGSKSINIILKLLKNEILNSPYRREPRAIKRQYNRYPVLTTSRKESKNEVWGYSRRRQSQGLKKVGSV
jgi:hypothetical protein